MLGGYQIINLSGMSVSMGSAVSISDQNVLKQLRTLREHIEENYDYSKPLNKRLKAVMIRLRDAESGEKSEGCLWGNLSIIDDNLSFNIDAVASVNPLKVLQINVVFEKLQDDDGNDYYDIKSAKYEYKGGEDVVTVTDIKNIPSAIINKLDCGDIVLKKDSSGLHAYIVSFRNATGICLTYADASCIETQSYDKVGQNWVYNSEDKGTLPEFASSGTIANVLGLDNESKLVKEARNSVIKPIYCHPVNIGKTIDANNSFFVTMLIFNNSPDEFTFSSFCEWLDNLTENVTTARILTSGNIVVGGTRYPAGLLYSTNGGTPVRQMIISPSSMEGIYLSLSKSQFEALTPDYFNDSVNKIN